MSEDWWQDFFSGPWLSVQREMWSQDATRVHADRIEQWFPEKAPGSSVLDVPCGEGRIALELTRRGWTVIGLDQSGELLADARDAAERQQLSVAWRQGDMREIEDVEKFDAAVCWWGSFGYFDDAGDARFARSVARALRPGGAFVIDMNLVESLLPQWQSRGAWRVGEVWVVEERVLDLRTSRTEVEWTFLSSGQPAVSRHSSIRLYTFRELDALLKDAGFAAVDAYDQATGEPFAVGAGMRRVTVVARKE